jgi:hypothetical protein
MQSKNRVHNPRTCGASIDFLYIWIGVTLLWVDSIEGRAPSIDLDRTSKLGYLTSIHRYTHPHIHTGELFYEKAAFSYPGRPHRHLRQQQQQQQQHPTSGPPPAQRPRSEQQQRQQQAEQGEAGALLEGPAPSSSSSSSSSSSWLQELPLPLLGEATAFLGDLRSTTRLLCRTSKPLARLGCQHPELWGCIPHVRLRCGQRDPPTLEEHKVQVLAAAVAPGLRSLELVCDRRVPIGYAAMTPVASFLPLAPRLRSLTIGHACLDDGVLAALQQLTELESLGASYGCIFAIESNMDPACARGPERLTHPASHTYLPSKKQNRHRHVRDPVGG